MLNSLPQSNSASQLLDTGVMLVGHGTRHIQGQQEFKHLFAQFSELMLPYRTALAFLELAQPDIRIALNQLSAQGVKQVLTVPVVLFTAGHAEIDIPQAVQQALGPLGMTSIGQTESLNCSNEVLELSAQRFRQAICPAECRSGCSGEVCPSTAWLMIGRGSSSEQATEMTREFCRLRRLSTPTSLAQTAFIHGQSPTVDEAMDEYARSGIKNIVVQPHLLFSGVLLEQLQEQVNLRQQQNPHQRWVITETLGSDRKLAELLARRSRAVLQRFCQNPV